MSELDTAAELITGAQSVSLACHVEPDGDALGSMLAMHHLCRANGVVSLASWPEPFLVAPHYTFLPGLDTCTKPVDFPDAPEVMVTFDCGSLARLNELAAPAGRAQNLIVLDHHATNLRFGTVNVVDTSAAATAVVVRNLAARLGWELNRDAAMCLYTGLVTDTGRFQFATTTPAVLNMAAELAAFDLPIAAMSRQLFEQHRFVYLQLVADCVHRAELDRDIGLVSTWVTQEDLDRYGVTIQETEGLIDIVRRTEEAEVACVLKESPTGIRVSLRAVSRVDVGAIALQFNGGGHALASGFTSPGTIESVLQQVRTAVARAPRA
jgi:phosphoesterase RecJ-like protein